MRAAAILLVAALCCSSVRSQAPQVTSSLGSIVMTVAQSGSVYVSQLQSDNTPGPRVDLLAAASRDDVAAIVDAQARTDAAQDAALVGNVTALIGMLADKADTSDLSRVEALCGEKASQAEFSAAISALNRTKVDEATLQRALAELNETMAERVGAAEAALGPVKEDVEALKEAVAELDGIVGNGTASKAELEELKETVRLQGERIGDLGPSVQLALCQLGIGLDLCGQCGGNASSSETCCDGHHFYGTGTAGNLVISSATDFASISFPMRVTPPSAGATTITMSGSNGNYDAGKLVLVINLQGTLNDYDNVGNYEFVRLTAVSGATLTLASPLVHNYASSTSQTVFVQIVPEFRNLDVNARVYVNRFSSSVSGVIALLVQNQLVFGSSGSLDASGAGFAGGSGSASGYCQWGYNGLGINQASSTTQGTSNIGGGAGGGTAGSWCNGQGEHAPMAGSGGSHGLQGAAGVNNPSRAAAYGGTPFTKLFLGGGGGGSSSYRHNSGSGHGGGGGSGGGIVIAMAKEMSFSSSIDFSVAGETGANFNTHGGSGGGGAGGSILLQADTVSRVGSFATYAGGQAGSGFYAGSRGGNGGNGRMSLQIFSELQFCHNGVAGAWACTTLESVADYCDALQPVA